MSATCFIVSGNSKREGAAPGGKPLFASFSAVFAVEESIGEIMAWAQEQAERNRGELHGAIRIERDAR